VRSPGQVQTSTEAAIRQTEPSRVGVLLVYWGLVYFSALFLYLVLNLQTNAFSKWAMPYRTSDLLLVSYVEVFLLRSVLLGNSAYLSDFQRFSSGANPAVFGSVLLRLQHVCSTL